jgi:hypothetical protein
MRKVRVKDDIGIALLPPDGEKDTNLLKWKKEVFRQQEKVV